MGLNALEYANDSTQLPTSPEEVNAAGLALHSIIGGIMEMYVIVGICLSNLASNYIASPVAIQTIEYIDGGLSKPTSV